MKNFPENIKLAFLSKGLRCTKKRQVIIDTFFKSPGHLTIEDLYKKVKKKDKNVGYVTVYRVLKTLKELGLAHQWQFGDGFSRFEKAGMNHHDHLICLKCHSIIEFEEPKIESLQEEVAKSFSFNIVSHVHEIHGYCKNCKAE